LRVDIAATSRRRYGEFNHSVSVSAGGAFNEFIC
jgi:hypothetical protein